MERPTARTLKSFAFQEAKHAMQHASNFAPTSAQAAIGLPDLGARAPRGKQQREVLCTNGTIAVDVGCS